MRTSMAREQRYILNSPSQVSSIAMPLRRDAEVVFFLTGVGMGIRSITPSITPLLDISGLMARREDR